MKAFAVAFMLAVLAFGFCGCQPKSPEQDRATARSVVLTVAFAVHQLDVLCASYVTASKDKAVGEECVRAWTMADSALTSAESAIDAWDDATQGRIACTVLDAVAAVKRFVDALDVAHIAPPESVKDALSLAAGLKGLCYAQ